MGRARAPYHSSGRHRRVPPLCSTRQDHCSGVRGECSGCRRGGGEGCLCRCLALAQIHTSSLTLPAKAFSLHTCAHSLSARARMLSQLGWGWVAGSQRGKPKDENTESDTDFDDTDDTDVAVQKGPKYFMHVCCIAMFTNMQPSCIYCISDIYFIFCIFCILSICCILSINCIYFTYCT